MNFAILSPAPSNLSCSDKIIYGHFLIELKHRGLIILGGLFREILRWTIDSLGLWL
jgi:hypothetical protein